MTDEQDDKTNVKDGNRINLKVATQDGLEIFFKCKATTPLSRLMTAFCESREVSLASGRFFFDGTRIKEHQTPSDVHPLPPPPPARFSSTSFAVRACTCWWRSAAYALFLIMHCS